MGVAAQRHAVRGRAQAALGVGRRADVAPGLRRPGVGVDEQDRSFLGLHGEACEERGLRRVETLPRPHDGAHRIGIHVGRGVSERRVVVAAHGERAVGAGRHHRVAAPGGVGAVADHVAQKDVPLHPAAARVGEAGGKRLPVGVDVGEDGGKHGVSAVAFDEFDRQMHRPPIRQSADRPPGPAKARIPILHRDAAQDRRKIDDDERPSVIVNIRNSGYVFQAP